MAKIKLHKTGRVIDASDEKSMMDNLLEANVPVASSCGGEGVCTKCKVKILKGKENLSDYSSREFGGLSRHQREEKGFRLSCQVKVLGNVEVDTDYW